MEGSHAAPQSRRQHLAEFQECAHGRFFNSGDGAACGGSQPDRDGHCFFIVEEQRRQGRAGSKLISSCDAGGRVHRIAEAAEPVYIAAQRAWSYFEAFRKLSAGPIAAAWNSDSKRRSLAEVSSIGFQCRIDCGLNLSAMPVIVFSRGDKSMSFSETLLPEFDEEMSNTRKLLACVPDGKFDYKPHEKSMTLGRLASHVAEMPSWAAYTLASETLDLPVDAKPRVAGSKAELMEMFDKNVPEAREKIAAASDEDWRKLWTLKIGDKAVLSMPRSKVMRSMVMNHMVHHRAQLGVFLRLNDVMFPGMYGPSADEKF